VLHDPNICRQFLLFPPSSDATRKLFLLASVEISRSKCYACSGAETLAPYLFSSHAPQMISSRRLGPAVTVHLGAG